MRWTAMAATALAAAAAGCAPTMDLPDGFVKVGGDEPYDMRAVSADGVVLALRGHDNPEDGTLAFWAEAVRNELTGGRDYKLTGDDPVASSGGLDGRLLSFSAERSGAPFTYLVAVFVTRRRVLVAEAGGAADAVKGKLAAIRRAMLTARP